MSKEIKLPLKFTWTEEEMEEFIADNISRLSLGFGPLTLVKRQASMGGAGRADIVAHDARKLYVIELKREIADESAMAQVMRYVGTLHSRVRGIVQDSGLDDDIDRIAKDYGTSQINACLIAQGFTEGALNVFSYLEAGQPGLFHLLEWSFRSFTPIENDHGFAVGRLYPHRWGTPFIDSDLSGDAEDYAQRAAEIGVDHALHLFSDEEGDEQLEPEPSPYSETSE